MYLLGIGVSLVYAMGHSAPKEKLEPIKVPDVTLQTPPMDCVPEDQRSARNVQYCPAFSDLYRVNNVWYGPNGNWKSYQFSFTTELTAFIGAQWVGTNVGRVVCLYSGNNSNDFPVQISLISLALTPDLPVWTKQKGQAYSCLSQDNQICDCPIQIFKEQEAPTTGKEIMTQLSAYNQ